MSVIRYGTQTNVLVGTKGHPFERDAFFAVFEALPDVSYTQVEQPALQAFFDPTLAAPYDAFVLYDMPGIEFRPGGTAVFHEPSPELVAGFDALLEAGQGIVFLHHAVAGWPTWDAYSDAVGCRFLYQPATLRGRELPDSGYRHAVTHRVDAVAPGHPVLEGLQDGFEIEDELYLLEVFEAEVTPLLRSRYRFVDENFYSSAQALEGRMFSNEGWSHPRGSDLIAWAKRSGNSRTVTILCGDSPGAYQNPGFRRLLANAIGWVSQPPDTE